MTLKELRTKKMLSLREVAKLVGVSPTSYNNWEKGYYKPHPKSLRKLVAVFGEEVIKILE
jgi:DNA-binding XRE family transcriptional regulator